MVDEEEEPKPGTSRMLGAGLRPKAGARRPRTLAAWNIVDVGSRGPEAAALLATTHGQGYPGRARSGGPWTPSDSEGGKP